MRALPIMGFGVSDVKLKLVIFILTSAILACATDVVLFYSFYMVIV